MKTALLFVALCFVGVAQPTAKFNVTVKLDIQSIDPPKSLVTSYIARELRSLGDVTIVGADEPSDYRIAIIVVSAEQNGSTVGYSVTWLTSRPAALGAGELVRGVHIEKFGVRLGPTDKLQSYCSEIVAEFDSKTLERDRKFWRITGHSPYDRLEPPREK